MDSRLHGNDKEDALSANIECRPNDAQPEHLALPCALAAQKVRIGRQMDRIFTRVASRIAAAMGQPLAFIIAVLTVLLWGVSGPLFGYSDTWQLIINTGTTIATF